MTGGIIHTPSHTNVILQFSTYIFSADISPEMLKLGRVTKVKVLFPVLVFVFNFDLFKFSAAILEKGLFRLSHPLFYFYFYGLLHFPGNSLTNQTWKHVF